MSTIIYILKKSFFSIFSLGFVFLSLLSLVSCTNLLPDCNACSSPPLSTLSGRWELLRWNRPPDATGRVTQRAIPHGDNGEPIMIEFNQDKKILSGYSGCNRFFAPITSDSKSAIVLGRIGSSMMMCNENYRMELEHDFLNQLEDYRSLNVKEDQLLLIGRTGDVLAFGRRGTSPLGVK
jgi:heat shock protein HslJ